MLITAMQKSHTYREVATPNTGKENVWFVGTAKLQASW